jgi:hypothetical protein
MIVFARRLEWPMVTLSLVLCFALLFITISGKRRVWWLIGLAPVLALFVRGFSGTYHPTINLLETPKFVNAESATVPGDEFVVGFVFEGKAYALPYRALAVSPFLLVTDFDKRALVVWSVTANRATVLPLARDARPREIEIVSRPADSLLLFDRRLGQFIVGVTGRTVKNTVPMGMGMPLATVKVPYAVWMARHPDSRVFVSSVNDANAPSTASLPTAVLPPALKTPDPKTRITLVATTQPTAIIATIPANKPMNIVSGETRVLLYREPQSGWLHAYDRRVQEDLFPSFKLAARPNKKHPEGLFVDADTQSLWSVDGKAVDGPLKGEKLREVPVEEGLYWGVMKFWMPELKTIELKTIDVP